MLPQASFHDAYRTDFKEDELSTTIESLRCQLLEVAQHRSLSDNVVVELSKQLDGYIVLAQNKMMERQRSRKADSSAHKLASMNIASRNQTAMQL